MREEEIRFVLHRTDGGEVSLSRAFFVHFVGRHKCVASRDGLVGNWMTMYTQWDSIGYSGSVFSAEHEYWIGEIG